MGPAPARGYARDGVRREAGQILPGLVMLLLAIIGLGVVAFQVGRATIMRSQAQTAADAAALAGVRDIERQLEAQWSTFGTTDIAAIDKGRVVAKMADYAHRNGGRLAPAHPPTIDGADVKAWTDTEAELGKSSADLKASEHTRGQAHARARLTLAPVTFGFSGGAPGADIGPLPTGGTARISPAEWKALDERLNHPVGCPDIITLGLFLKAHGFFVWQNDDPRLGGDAGHEDRPDSWHRKCNDRGAIDVNFDNGGTTAPLNPVETNAIDPLIGPIRKLGFRTIWRDGGQHDNHLHIDPSKTGSIGAAVPGAPSMGTGGFTGPLEDTGLDVKLIDWEAPAQDLASLGGPQVSGTYGGPPDQKIMALMCRMTEPYGAKIRLAAFETALVESGIHNLNYGDAHSHGVFQQQWDQGWGTLADTMNPVAATQMFLDAARAASRKYPNVTAGQLSAIVQRPREDLRGEYEKRRDQATALIKEQCT
jgi:hypothetical protein